MDSALLYLWQPVIWANDDKTIDVTITRGESGNVGTGGPAFIAAIVAKLGLDKPKRNKVIPFRSQRFNDDLKADEWQDRWPIAWCLLLGYEAPQKPKTLSDSIGIEAMDETFDDEHKHWNLDNVDCRVLVDFESENKAKAAAAAYTNARIGKAGGTWRVEVIAGKIRNASPDAVLASGNKIVSSLSAVGGVVSLRS